MACSACNIAPSHGVISHQEIGINKYSKNMSVTIWLYGKFISEFLTEPSTGIPQTGEEREKGSGTFRFWTDARRFKGSEEKCIVQRALFASGGVLTYPSDTHHNDNINMRYLLIFIQSQQSNYSSIA